MRRSRTALLVTFVTLGLGITACGGDSQSACGLISDDEVERILGTATRPGEVDDDTLGPGTNCAWISEDSTRDPEAAVYGVHLWTRSDDEAHTEFDRRQRRRTSDTDEIEPVAGLGDEAYFVVPTEPNSISGVPSLPTLYVRVGDQIVGVGTFDSDERPIDAQEARTIERAAARAALPRLSD